VVSDILVNAIERERVYGQVRRLNEELERRVRERTAQLEAMNQELESLSYPVSHDLRAPLRHIEGYTRILEREHAGGLNVQGRRSLSRVRAAAERMGQLIDDLLALSRVTRAEMRIESVNCPRWRRSPLRRSSRRSRSGPTSGPSSRGCTRAPTTG
jgi:light-regulated signal transduction histidine kinase (bacteriophytochrome)